MAQNIATYDSGAYTGEISASMVSDYASYAIIGHSERRSFFNETNSVLLKKINMCFKYNITPIFCVGENIEDRKKGTYLSIIEKQLNETIMSLNFDPSRIILAYEPTWAIGTGEHANSEQITEVHNHIRLMVSKKNGASQTNQIPILYGGSCNSENAQSILSQENVNGLLIGGASLDLKHFLKIIKISHEIS